MTAVERQGAREAERAKLKPVYDEVNALVRQLPDAPDDGGLSLYLELLGASSWKQLDAPWAGRSMTRYAGVLIIVDGVHKMPSTIDSPLEHFVVAHLAVEGTGDEGVFVTSSLGVTIQLVNAHRHRWLPLSCVPRVVRRTTGVERESHHLEIRAFLGDGTMAGAA